VRVSLPCWAGAAMTILIFREHSGQNIIQDSRLYNVKMVHYRTPSPNSPHTRGSKEESFTPAVVNSAMQPHMQG
jgi:hypothetical protein